MNKFASRSAWACWIAIPIAALAWVPALGSESATDAAAPSGAQTVATVTRSYPSIARKSLPDYVRTADTVVVARVSAMSEEHVEGAGLSKLYQLQVLDALKGAPPELIAILVDATSGQDLLRSAGEPRGLAIGDEAVYFLQHCSALGTYGVLGLSGGVYRIATNSGGARVVTGLHAPSARDLGQFSDELRLLAAVPTPSKR